MKKSIMILMLVTTGFFCFGQSSTDSLYVGTVDSVKSNESMTQAWRNATLSEEIKSGRIYNSLSPHHNVLHQFTYLVVMRDYFNEALAQMRASDRVNKKLSEKLKTELSKAKGELTSSKFKGLNIETGYYDLFLKQIKDQFTELCSDV